jgi:hypothetical protein
MYSVEEPQLFDTTAELGMGFHFGILQSSAQNVGGEGVMVLNAQLALTPRDILDFESIRRWQWTRGRELVSGVTVTAVMAPEPAPIRRIVPSDDVVLFTSAFGRFIAVTERFELRDKLHASPPFPLQTHTPEPFGRFSAFKNDRRVRPDGSLLAGTYVTSERDAGHAPSGYAVVARYALPNPMSAINRTDILVPAQTSGLVGTVLPAFGQSGGGVEVELTNGASAGSVTRRTTIPEY